MPSSSSPAHISARLATFREKMFAKGKLDAVIVSDRMDGYYLTGFSGEDGLVIVTPQRVVLLTDGRFDEQAEREAPWAGKVLRKGPMAPVLVGTLKRLKARQAGFFPAALSYKEVAAYRKALQDKKLLKNSAPIRFSPVKDEMREQRLCKDQVELISLRKAVQSAQKAFLETLPLIQPGMTELDLAAELIYRMQRHGAEGPSFPPIVASGPNAALAHYRPRPVPIDFRTGLLIDWGARQEEYCSDLTRVLFPRRGANRWYEIYQVCLDAQMAAIEAIQPGVPMRKVDAIARKVMKSRKCDKYFTHGLGHGIGLNIHEGPRLSRYVDKKDTLKPGMVVTVEPGIYLAGEAGVRIEDNVLVTETGHEVLTSVPKLPEAMRFG